MCQFLSALVLRDGTILSREDVTDSHEILIKWYSQQGHDLRDDREFNSRFVRVEYAPKFAQDAGDLNNYRLVVDEQTEPAWFAAHSEEVARALRRKVKRCIVSDSRDLLIGGPWILTGDAIIGECHSARVVSMHDSSKVDVMYGSSKVDAMYGSSKVVSMHDSSKIGSMCDSSKIGVMLDSSKVDTDKRMDKK